MALIGLMKPAAGVIATRPTTIAVAPPTAVTFWLRIRSSSVHTTSVPIGARNVVVNASAADGPARERAAGVEAEPAEPEQPGAEQHERHVVRQERLAREVLARAEHEGGDERRHAGVHVDDGAAREVERAELSPASRRPTPSARPGA